MLKRRTQRTLEKIIDPQTKTLQTHDIETAFIQAGVQVEEKP